MHIEKLEIPIKLLPTKEAASCLSVSEHWLKASRFRPELDGPPFIRASFMGAAEFPACDPINEIIQVVPYGPTDPNEGGL